MQVIGIINEARNMTNEKGQFTNPQLIGFLNKGISEVNFTLSVNFPLIPMPYEDNILTNIQDITATVANKTVYPYANFTDSHQFNIFIPYVCYLMLMSKRDDTAMYYKNEFDTAVRSLNANFTFDSTNKFKSKVRTLSFNPIIGV